MYTYEKQISRETGYELVIAGAGPAGCAAALSAGRAGVKTLLLEAGTRPGGIATSGMVSAFAPMSDGERPVAGGIALELNRALYSRGAFGPHVTPEFWEAAIQRWIPFRPEELALLYDELLAEAGVAVRYAVRAVDVDRDGDRIRGLVTAGVEGLSYIPGDLFIDATGDAQLTAAAGFPVRTAGRDTKRIMPPTLCALFAGIQWDEMEYSGSGNCPKDQQKRYEEALAEGRFSHNDKHLPGLYRIGPGLGMLNAGHLFNTDAVDGESLSAAYVKGRKLVREYLDFYRRSMPGCEEMQLVATAPLLGVRESRRIAGEYELSYEDYRTRRSFPDGIGRCAGSVDIHVYDDSEEEYRRYHSEFNTIDRNGPGDSFAIPFRAMLPKGAENLIVAGRSISTDVKVQGAVRIQPAATVMGEAAGTAATLALESKTTCRAIDIAMLRKRLVEGGAVLE